MNLLAQILWLLLVLFIAGILVQVIDWFIDAWINRPWRNDKDREKKS